MRLKLFAATAALLVALTIPGAGAGAGSPHSEAALRGAEFIRTTQQPDGGFGGFGPGQSLDAILAIRSAGLDPNTFVTGGKSPADFVAAHADDLAASPALAGKAALAARALGLDARNVAGADFIAAIVAGYDATTGQYAEDAFGHSLAMLGLVCAGGAPAPASAVLALRETQLDDGGWGFGGFADPDTTALALQALIAAGVPVTDPAVVQAVAYLQSTQGNDGGWGFDPDASNANSTALAIQGLLAAGEDVEAAAYARAGVTPIAYLLSIQQPDGSFPGFDPAFATNQTVPALAGKTLCNAPVTPLRAVPAADPSPTPRPPATGGGNKPGATAAGANAANAAALVFAAGAGMFALGGRRSRR